MNIAILEGIYCMLLEAGLPKILKSEVVSTRAFLIKNVYIHEYTSRHGILKCETNRLL